MPATAIDMAPTIARDNTRVHLPIVVRDLTITPPALAGRSAPLVAPPVVAPAPAVPQEAPPAESSPQVATPPERAPKATAPTEVRRGLGWRLAEGGQLHLNQRTQAHQRSIEQTGIGLYYGLKSNFRQLSKGEQQAWLAARSTSAEAAPPAPRMSSCIGWAMENVKAAYEASGKGARWQAIEQTMRRNAFKGTVLAQELQKDGWEAVYFNPDTRHPNDGNSEHPYTARLTAQGKPYYGIRVNHRVTDYRPTQGVDPGRATRQDSSGIERLREVPFFFGVARGGTHTFVGQNGRVNEFHWAADPDDVRAIDETPLEDFVWNSGVIMVPPGTWPAATKT